MVRLGLGLIGPNAGHTAHTRELELGAGAGSSTRLMTAGCHQNRTSQESFRMLCDGAPTNLEAKVVQVKFLPGGGWDDGMDVLVVCCVTAGRDEARQGRGKLLTG